MLILTSWCRQTYPAQVFHTILRNRRLLVVTEMYSSGGIKIITLLQEDNIFGTSASLTLKLIATNKPSNLQIFHKPIRALIVVFLVKFTSRNSVVSVVYSHASVAIESASVATATAPTTTDIIIQIRVEIAIGINASYSLYLRFQFSVYGFRRNVLKHWTSFYSARSESTFGIRLNLCPHTSLENLSDIP